ncbi:MAG TPA: hypothetical protein VE863_20310 [Pyrinomonadaceae bacterium]|jgi:hypothetical protein|nr:hypothetical protein [Pyrinomonadaceae bacterium]
MNLFLPLTFVAVLFGQGLELGTSNQSVTVVSYKWSTIHDARKQQDLPSTSPAPEMTAANKSVARNQRVNNPNMIDTSEMTVDGRSAAMEKAVQQARNTKPESPDKYSYVMRIHNGGSKPIDVVFWEYQFVTAQPNSFTTRRQFLCGVKIKRDKDADLQGFSLLGPTPVVNASGNRSSDQIQERVIINRIEFTDGTIWQRRDWNFAEIRDSIRRALDNPWEGEMCRAL